ncbi:MAG TPA: HAD-IA family hydrolase [Polyangiales bacterium]|nr:HAD-IA family hydrolase [Polyangiales bacterium]
MAKVRALVFDLDGTLIDSVLDIAEAANHALQGAGYPQRSVDEIRSFVGDGARSLVARAAELPLEDARLDALLETFLAYYTAHPTRFTELLPGAREALARFPELRIALCTNKPRVTTQAVLAGLGLEQSFSAIVAGGDLPQKKPDPAPLLHIAELLGLSPGELVMVGDGPQDVESARAAGARSIGVENGIADLARLRSAEPDAMIATLHDLPALIARWQDG